MVNQTPEQIARDNIDKQLSECGWIIQGKKQINLQAGHGVAVKEYQTASGPADYVLFVDGKPVGIIEAKKEEEAVHLTVHEDQSKDYADSKLKHLDNDPLPFVYESTGIVTRFTDYRDPKPRSRPLFTFHRPETLRDWLKQDNTLRRRIFDIPVLRTTGLRDCQIKAINNLENSFRANQPKALIQMATGSGKTFTAITAIYRLLTYARAKRVLFLVDTRNLGEQAEQEFMAYVPNDDNRKFSELYGVHRLKSGFVPTDNQVYISTIQRLYSILKEEELDEKAEEANPAEIRWEGRQPVPVGYNPKLPIEFFDFIVIDECHRSIYNLWKQVLDYFDAFLIGLTATPDNRTFGFFNQNIVSEYTHEQAVTDGVNVGSDVYIIDTEITKKGGNIWKGQYVDRREKLTRKKRWEQLDEDVNYTGKQLDNDVVNPNQIRTVIRAFKEHLPEMFPDRINEKGELEVPKTLIFAKTDSHADDIIQIVREEFGEENKFCKKITYNSDDPKSILAQFRNAYHPRIAVTVDMIATGTDVRPLECLLFMRDVKSRNYFEQMKGRGTRTITLDDLKKVTPTARYTKDHYVIVDAVGVTQSLKTDSRPLERKPSVPLKDLLEAITVGARDEDLFTSLANRLTRLEKQLSDKEQANFAQKAKNKTIKEVVKELLNAYNPDTLEEIRLKIDKENPDAPPVEKEEKVKRITEELQNQAASTFTGELNDYIENVRKAHEQIIDMFNPDKLVAAGWDKDNKERAEELVKTFAEWIAKHKDEITALQIFYAQPYRRRELTYSMIRELVDKIIADKPTLAPLNVWRAYELLESVSGQPRNELVALVSLIRKVAGIDDTLTAYDKTVDKNFQNWVFKKQAGTLKFTEEQMLWLRMIKDHIAASVSFSVEDLDYLPFDAQGGKGKMWQLFGNDTEKIINELNEALAA
ncbi:MAG TPA: type I restriction-modification enzyme R subunit C-terminal domain-containing protein [Smithellaceae bacterium]|jgi:type I restriction enzyme R subunit|nr:MAG: Type-1 restriction enzyme R protein [Deltaproteobacteria bacterium ADurb.BinA014]HNV63992.1 type I restriction-modification enzyme R subunit C-terminal domain-containing protein [Smithellaceae bacterium]HOD31239.1 type I restriction-modification enzyme R subunit C-terminal domain-containing protein [Smithellaceae bacterium]HOF77955.1 type I restriction-modification enzyme R subunit C-terminal domain-containing protein [Smithellaceae bacterium]HOS09416.1 type I restriction-modification e